MSNRFTKDPNAQLDYQIDWSSWLATGEQIATSSWIVPAGITKLSESNTTTTTTIWLSGGTHRYVYQLTNRIVTNSNPARTEDRSIYIHVEER